MLIYKYLLKTIGREAPRRKGSDVHRHTEKRHNQLWNFNSYIPWNSYVP